MTAKSNASPMWTVSRIFYREAGAAGAATGCIQMATGEPGLVATLYDGHSALSMTAPYGAVLASRF
jgi:hypothetical protein